MNDNITVAEFAPVLIPTLCRYEHFRNCLDSLSRCTLADRTEVYVGLDYPLVDSHRDGYEKIKAYLSKYMVRKCFKALHVMVRDSNYGVNGNFQALLDHVSSHYDRWIVSEDDNVFSPNFLVFINKGLEKFKDDKSVFAINGYRHFYDVKTEGNTFFRQNVDFSAWGYGIWKDRYELYSMINYRFYKKNSSNIRSIVKLWRNGYMRLACMYSFASRKWDGCKTDNALSVYMALKDCDVVMPTISCVRNCGVDGSGVNFHVISECLKDRHLAQTIDNKSTFIFIGTGREYYDENKRIYRTQSYGRISLFALIKVIVKYYFKMILRL